MNRIRMAIVAVLLASFAGFAYVLEGRVQVGDDARPLRAGQVGWFDATRAEGTSALHHATTGDDGARAMLYAAPPLGEPIATHGPFVGGSRADLMRVSQDYVNGRFVRMSDLAR